eukprot:g2536.t1
METKTNAAPSSASASIAPPLPPASPDKQEEEREEGMGMVFQLMQEDTASIVVEQKIREIIASMETEEDGTLTKVEVKVLAGKMGEKLTTLLSHKKLDKAFAQMDSNKDGRVEIDEFIRWHHCEHPTKPAHLFAQIKRRFNELDVDGVGTLSKKDVLTLMKRTGNKISGFFNLHTYYGEKGLTFQNAYHQMAGLDDKVSLQEFLDWHCMHHKLKSVKASDIREPVVVTSRQAHQIDHTKLFEDGEHPDTKAVESEIVALFKSLDTDGSGELQENEFKNLAHKMGIYKHVTSAFDEIDKSGDGKVSLKEFIAWHHRTHPVEPRDVYHQIKFLFKKNGFDKKERLTKGEVGRIIDGKGHLRETINIAGIVNDPGATMTLDKAFKEMMPDESHQVDSFSVLTWLWNRYFQGAPLPVDFVRDCKQQKADIRRGSFVVRKYEKGKNPLTILHETQARKLFAEIDADGSGKLDRKEVKVLVERMGDPVTSKELDVAFNEMDPNNDGIIDVDEFIAWYHRQHPVEPHHVHVKVKYVFEALDEDMLGFLNKAAIKKLIERLGMKGVGGVAHKVYYGRPGKSFETAFQEIDEDGTGTVSLYEILQWVCRIKGLPPPNEEDDLADIMTDDC